MQSTDLSRWGILRWEPITSENVPEVVAMIPAVVGVYVFKTRDMMGRVQGVSDIAYIGSSLREGGVQARVREHFYRRAPESTKDPSGRINQWTSAWGYDVDVGWLVRSSKELAATIERELLEAYEVDHHELPPLNRSMPGFRIGAAG